MDTENYENRNLAEKPVFTIENYKNFSSEYTAYFNDTLPFRNALISLNSSIDYYLFGRSTNESVIVGKEGWLFYSKYNDGDSLAVYQGTNTYTQADLEVIAANILAQRDILASEGREFVLFIVPNKERIYSEYMPDVYGDPAEVYRSLQVYNYFKENTDLRIVYCYDDLMAAKEKTDVDLYYKTDTHWNYVGAYVAAGTLLNELGVSMPDVSDPSIKIWGNTGLSGDLAGMLNLKKQMQNVDTVYVVSGYDKHDMQTVSVPDAAAYSAVNADERKLFVIRDSFGVHIAPVLGSQFSETYIIHRDKYNYESLCEQDPDIVVFEFSERAVNYLSQLDIKKQ